MNELATIVVGAVAGGLVGGGAIMGLAWHALENKLGRTFARREGLYDANGARQFAKLSDVQAIGDKVRDSATRSELNGLSQRYDERLDRKRRDIEGVTSLFTSADGRLARVEDQVIRLEERTAQQWERVGEQMSNTAQTLRETVGELRDVTATVQALAAEVRALQGKIP